ncbi:vWA domain-containing protein [Corallococcus llansteffanensis]|uniref:VWA domain-containing protein n=1 Tax=Corallococcus llansteffanensis TaxID=2316731 RepID=A0A3A8P838_9BACT|nr:vWA domain-containing protein [Corallococcus llansteffanensis]RKH50671.1 VWA domain-containing protein [Corallococcus llansteffanensis]
MLARRLTQLRQRLDALRQPPMGRGASWSWPFGRKVRGPEDLSLPVLVALDRELDRVGVHTAADARLLLALGTQRGRAGVLAQGLAARAAQALEEFEECLRLVERAHRSGEMPAGAPTALDRGFVRLARAVKVADLFGRPLEPFEDDAPFEIFERPVETDRQRPPASARLAIAEMLAGRARENVIDLVQKRRDLDLAHEMLLRLGTDADRARSMALRNDVAEARERVREVPPTRSLDALVRNVRENVQKDPRGAYRSLQGLYERALEAGDAELAAAARSALKPLLPPEPRLTRLVEEAESESLVRWLGESDAEEAPARAAEDGPDERLADLAFSLKPEQLATFDLAAGCARYFDVEDSLTEEIVESNTTAARAVPRQVPYPTQTMSFATTGSLDELHHFVITDPRRILQDLAAHRQLVRTYLDDAPPPRPRKVKRTAVRVYVCDASGSMHGARARFRDALIIAELNNLRVKARRGEAFDPLYFSFFNDVPTELARVDTAAEATRQIEKLFHDSPAEGQTDISLALLSAFDSIRAAQGRDPYLARATVVLITDGEDRVDLDLIRRTRAPMGALDIALSFISLGEENPDLKSLVLEQRAAGGRAFYHPLSDEEIRWARTEFDTPWRTLLPRDVPPTLAALESLAPHLDALEAVAAGRVPLAGVAVEASFDALFPASPAPSSSPEAPGPDVAARVADILEAVGEAASLAPADRRATESVVLLQHLLSVYGLTPARYLAVLSGGGRPVGDALERVRLLCRPFG